MQNEGLTNAEFAEKLGISTSSLSHIFSGRNNPSLEVVMRIHKACPYVNLNWLLYGEGQMKEEENPVRICLHQATERPRMRKSRATLRAVLIFQENASDNHVFPPKETVIEKIKYIEKPQPKISEIRIFFRQRHIRSVPA